jgi:nitrate/TMAO reductase-like tetraheme cytochrome c subunit
MSNKEQIMGRNLTMNNESIFQEAIQSVHDAEDAVIKAQSFDSPQFLQSADQKLQLASQQLHEIQVYILTANEEQQKQVHHAKEQLRNLQENRNSLT